MWEALFWRYGVPLLIKILTSKGALNTAQTLAAEAIVWTENNIKTFSEYQGDDKPTPSTTNINKG